MYVRRLCGLVAVGVILASAVAAEDPPPSCQGFEPYQFAVQGSIDNGNTWHAGSLSIYGQPGQEVHLKVRTLLTVTTGQTEGWSFSLKHDPSWLKYYGGDLTIQSVTTQGTQTATVKYGNPPDFDETSIREGFKGYTQGVVIDFGQQVNLPPTSDFVTSGACYLLKMPTIVSTYYQASLRLTSDVGKPPILCSVSQEGQSLQPCAGNLTLNIYPGYGSSGYCSAGNWLGGKVTGTSLSEKGEDSSGKNAPLQPRQDVPVGAPISCADANADYKVDLTDPVYLLNYLFVGGPEPPTVNTLLVLKTGQTLCYDDDGQLGGGCSNDPSNPWYGQDAHYQYGHPREYVTVEGDTFEDDTVIDVATGLMWEKYPKDEAFLWSQVAAEVAGRETGGYTDWRLPTAGEMLSICDYSNQFFALASEFDLDPTKYTSVWTSTPYALDPTNEWKWTLDLIKGALEVGRDFAGWKLGIIAVRSYREEVPYHEGAPLAPLPEVTLGDSNGDGELNITDSIYTLNWLFLGGPVPCRVARPVLPEMYAPARFADNGDGTITDTFTGLVWRQDSPINDQGFPSGDVWNWQDALIHTKNMQFPPGSGPDDWRLPNVFELATLIDFSKSTQPVFPDVFDLTADEPSPLWTSTTSVAVPTFTWFIGYNELEAAAGSILGEKISSPAYGAKVNSSTWFLAVRGPETSP